MSNLLSNRIYLVPGLIGVVLALFVSCLSFSVFGLSISWALIIGLNLAAFCLCGLDKSAAMAGSIRVPEQVLLGFGLLGGSMGLLLGMQLLRHKTRKSSFQFWLCLILVAQIILYRVFNTPEFLSYLTES